MVARLWWKDARQFWPIWVFLAACGLAAQGLAIHYVGTWALSGALAVAALGWTCLYAFAVAAAAFAGERESRTLILLDALPVERWQLWKAKVSFAFVSTVALGLLLFIAAALATDKWELENLWWGILSGAKVLLVVLGCSLFWSTVMSNALLAAVLGVCTALSVVPAFAGGLNLRISDENRHLLELVLGALGIVTSGFLFVRSGPPHRPLVRRRVQPLTNRPAAAPVAVENKVMRRPRFWPAATRSLVWQTLREMRWTWLCLGLLCLAVPPCFYWGQKTPAEAWMLCILTANIVAGVSVFGIENRAGTQRFLANKGVHPGLVWLIKISTWLTAMVALCVLTAVVVVVFADFNIGAGPAPAVALFVLSGAVLSTLAIPILCGMVIRRGITAGMVALLVLVLVLPVLSGLLAMGTMPSVFFLLVPLAFLAVSLAWSRDWLLDRPGARRWVKLAVLLAGCFGALFAAYVAVRVLGVPTLDPAREAQILQFTTPGAVSAPDNAADLYRQAARSIQPMPLEALRVVQANALELVRKASSMPLCQFSLLDKLTVFSFSSQNNSHLRDIDSIPRLLRESIVDHQDEGDLDGAWNDLVVMFRVARQWSGRVPLNQALTALNCERAALSRAMLWAADSRQTVERLTSALDACRKLPPMPTPAEPIRAEAQIVRNTVNLPRKELVERLFEMRAQDSGHSGLWLQKLWVDLVTTPWELARTRRAFRLLYASEVMALQAGPPYAGRGATGMSNGSSDLASILGSHGQIIDPAALNEIEKSSPLLQEFHSPVDGYLAIENENEVERRACLQVLGLRQWQLRHDGRMPEKLQELVASGVLAVLPDDPYRPGHAFGYVRSSGQELLPLGEFSRIQVGSQEHKRLRPTAGSWLLYSVGPDKQDNGASTNQLPTGSGDLIFPLAESTISGQKDLPHRD
jgi:ABC-type transport system involved in multi-copper enzyme maturation permease subunit